MMRFRYWRAFTLFGPRWRWHLKAGNNEIIAHGEGYRNRADCLHAIELVQGAAIAVVEEAR